MKRSLRVKTVLAFSVFAILLIGISSLLSWRMIESMSSQQYRSRGDELAASVACVIDADKVEQVRDDVMRIYRATEDKVGSEQWGSDAFEAYSARFSEVKDTVAFRELMAFLRDLQQVNSVDCLYLVALDVTDAKAVYLLDATLEDPCPPGCIDPLYEMNLNLLQDPTIGFPAYITNTEVYGWLITAGAPIVDGAGEVIGYAMVDISMNTVKEEGSTFILRLIVALAAITVLLCAIVTAFVDRSLIRPINLLSQYAASYADSGSLQNKSFRELDIRTGDEIESLHKSMMRMEEDIGSYIDNLMRTQAILDSTRQEAQKLIEVAHRDALTGIRNKMAYDQEIAQLDDELRKGNAAFGIAMIDMDGLKRINDAYGHACGNVSLIRLSGIISQVFAHSHVFRIGGDEFAVILRDVDFDRIEDLANTFRDALASQDRSAEPWKVVSATMGYALFDPAQDTNADDVFRRADQSMYAHKKAR